MQEKDVYADLASIRTMMERSSKFISLSGLSGVLAGLYALIGARFAARITTNHYEIGSPPENVPVITKALIVVALAVVLLSGITAYWLSARKAKKKGENIWNPVSKRLLVASGIPFLTGGLFVAMLIMRGEYGLIASSFLIFYGLALVAGSQYTYQEVKWLGICEILLGLIALAIPGNGLLLWTIGFSLLHIVYGIFMHVKYER